MFIHKAATKRYSNYTKMNECLTVGMYPLYAVIMSK